MRWLPLVLMTGCELVGGGPGGTGGPVYDELSVQEFSARYVPAWCEQAMTCGSPYYEPGELDLCLEERGEIYDDTMEWCDYVPEGGASCIEELEARTEDCSMQAAGACFGFCAL